MNALLAALPWSATTIALYLLSKALYRRHPSPWLAPIIVTPAALILVILAQGTRYSDYHQSTGWLSLFMGPATVAFAIPIHEHRAVVRRHWKALVAGMIMGSGTAMLSAWGFAALLGMDDTLRLSLMPRSFSTPFAMTVSGDIGGIPDMTALYVMVTGILGATLGEILLYWLPIRSALAKGALFGMGAHAVGVVKARQIGPEEGSIAGIVMVLVGIANVIMAPLLATVLKTLS